MTPPQKTEEGSSRLFEKIEEAEHSSLEAVRKFLDTVDEALPAVGKDQSRRKIIDSAFQMTEHLVSTSTELARNIFDLTEKARTEADEDSDAAK